jgi:hypothetical protein
MYIVRSWVSPRSSQVLISCSVRFVIVMLQNLSISLWSLLDSGSICVCFLPIYSVLIHQCLISRPPNLHHFKCYPTQCAVACQWRRKRIRVGLVFRRNNSVRIGNHFPHHLKFLKYSNLFLSGKFWLFSVIVLGLVLNFFLLVACVSLCFHTSSYIFLNVILLTGKRRNEARSSI